MTNTRNYSNYVFATLRKKLNVEKCGAIGGRDLPEGRELKDEEDSNQMKKLSTKITVLVCMTMFESYGSFSENFQVKSIT